MNQLTLIFFTTIMSCEGAKMLFLSPIGSKSHKNFFYPIVLALAEKGHQVCIKILALYFL